MNQNKIVITQYQGRPVLCLFQNDILTELSFQESDSRVGNIYVGRIQNIVPNINAAFVEIGKNELTYFSLKDEMPIYLNRKNTTKPVVGDEILIQVVKDGIKTKAPQVSSKLTLAGKYLVLNMEAGLIGISNKIRDDARRKALKKLVKSCIPDKFGAIIRTNAADADPIAIEAEADMLSDRMKEILEIAGYRKTGQCLYQVPDSFISRITGYCNTQLVEIITDIPEIYTELVHYFELYDESAKQKLRLYHDEGLSLSSAYNLQKTIDHAATKRVWMKSGAYLIIEQTEAMVVIDVNTGKATGRQNMEEHFFKINVEAAKECAYQIRLRNLSGIIIIDFINMQDAAHNQELVRMLKEELAKDSIQTNYIDTTSLGLVEITRKKVHKSLAEQLKTF